MLVSWLRFCMSDINDVFIKVDIVCPAAHVRMNVLDHAADFLVSFFAVLNCTGLCIMQDLLKTK